MALEATAEAHKHYIISEDPLNRKQINAVAAAIDIAGKQYGEPI